MASVSGFERPRECERFEHVLKHGSDDNFMQACAADPLQVPVHSHRDYLFIISTAGHKVDAAIRSRLGHLKQAALKRYPHIKLESTYF